ncbi:amidohydrolase [Flavobacterium litorale]|uniref:Amidohydrolase n=1 Tax=Flavobacterium litorale TaxID=2856519 RepID=A0ABX8VCE4_9FLAO|nr:amidohydrolase [Flavobacterium litorale]QYJ68848.1 amidohydrolase [Flavobacterium litorale]
MKITLIQQPLVWENPQANRDNLTEKINIIAATDVIVLPEMFATGFTMQPEKVAEATTGTSVQWMQEIAIQKNCAVTGSLAIKENGKYYNRLFFVYPNGEYKIYNKRHLFTLAGEEEHYTAGIDKLVLEYKGWKICPLICYDLRFPVFARNTEDYDLLLYVANWPKIRIAAWDALLRARAIENMCYTIGVNRVGEDNNGYPHNGHSQVVAAMGNYVMPPTEKEGVFTVTLDKELQDKARAKFGFLNDRDSFTLQD